MTKLARLPVQHPRRPHCLSCGADLPTFNNAILDAFGGLAPVTLDAVTFHVTCPCGAKWDLRKSVRK